MDENRKVVQQMNVRDEEIENTEEKKTNSGDTTAASHKTNRNTREIKHGKPHQLIIHLILLVTASVFLAPADDTKVEQPSEYSQVDP